MRKAKRFVACTILRKQLVFGSGREGTYDVDEGFPFVYLYRNHVNEALCSADDTWHRRVESTVVGEPWLMG